MKRTLMFILGLLLFCSNGFSQEKSDSLFFKYFGIPENYEEIIYLQSNAEKFKNLNDQDKAKTLNEMHNYFVANQDEIVKTAKIDDLKKFIYIVKTNHRSNMASIIGTLASALPTAVASGIATAKNEEREKKQKREEQEQAMLAQNAQQDAQQAARVQAASSQYMSTSNYGQSNAKATVHSTGSGQQFAGYNNMVSSSNTRRVAVSSDPYKNQSNMYGTSQPKQSVQQSGTIVHGVMAVNSSLKPVMLKVIYSSNRAVVIAIKMTIGDGLSANRNWMTVNTDAQPTSSQYDNLEIVKDYQWKIMFNVGGNNYVNIYF